MHHGGDQGTEPSSGSASSPSARSLRRKMKGLLKGKNSESTLDPHSSPVAASAATVLVDAPPAATKPEVSEQGREASNILPAGQLCSGNNLSKHRALVLDCAYRPINVISWPKAVMMDWTQKAEVVEYYPPPATALSGQGMHMLPAVIRVPTRYVDLNGVAAEVACTRRNILVRDKFTCQYCGCNSKTLTLDHILPVSKGGRNSWTNLVAACMPCNQRKGDKLLAQLGWKLRSTPKKPTPWEVGLVVGLGTSDVERPCPEWVPYLEPYRLKIQEIKQRANKAGHRDPDGAAEVDASSN